MTLHRLFVYGCVFMWLGGLGAVAEHNLVHHVWDALAANAAIAAVLVLVLVILIRRDKRRGLFTVDTGQEK